MNNTEKRVDKIVKSMNPMELLQFDIAQALTFDSHEEWLSASDEYKNERSAETSRALSAFITRINKQYLPVVAEQKIRDALYQSQFLRRLWAECNLYVDDVTEKMRPQVRLLTEQQLRAFLELSHQKSTDYSGDAEKFLEDLHRTRSAISTIRRQYFGNQPVLFQQSDRGLGGLIAAAEEAAETHNKIDELERAMAGQSRRSRVDVTQGKLAAKKSSDAVVQKLVQMAESRARADLGRSVPATEILISELKANLR